MKWSKNLYIGDSIKKKSNKIRKRIDNNKITIEVYLICYPSNEENLLDIIPARELLQKAYPKTELYIVGMAKGYDEAVGLVQQIVKDTIEKTGDVKVRDYLASLGGDE